MSWLSNFTGVHISPHGFSVEPKKLLGDAAMLTGGGLLGKAGGYLASKIGGGGDSNGVNLDANGLEVQGGGGGSPQGGSTNPWLLGLAGLEGLNSAYLGNKANNLSNQALNTVQQSYADRAGLRAKGIAGLTNPTAPDVSNLNAIRANNPYSQMPKQPIPLAT